MMPSGSPVDYHKRQYLTVCKRLMDTSLSRARAKLWQATTSPGRVEELRRENDRELRARMSHHRAALVNLGFLIERRISVTNRVAICSLVAPFEFWSGESGLRFFVERFDWL